ncbi:MAG TPA: peptidoglycan DD-metalloendopeptidase family protein [Candidatus Acidoferrum sp.]|nr:peptidoglycan DD-metalloendopeptidase family protein [Candidatus Acidoferrum sp.]
MQRMRALLIGCLWLPTLLLAASKEATREELSQIEQSIGKVQKEIAALNHQRSDLHGKVMNSEQAINKLQRKLDDLGDEIGNERDSLNHLQTQATSLQQQRQAQQELLAGYLRSAWINGREEYLKLLLTQQNPGDAARMSQYYQYFGEARMRAIGNYNGLLNQIAAAQTAIADTTEKLAQRQAELQGQKGQLSEEQSTRQQLLAKLDTDLTDRSKKLNSLEQQRVELQLLMDELTRRSHENLASTDKFAASKGKLPWPLQGKVVHAYGARHELGDLTYEGMDLAAPAGTEVKAIHHGRVVFADWFGSSGLLLIIDHGDGYMSLYAHNQQLHQKLGAYVQRGDVIATVGNTGGQTQSGLYFEIRHEGKAENPVSWCMPRN